MSLITEDLMVSLLGVAFTAWAGVVWHGVREVVAELKAIRKEFFEFRLKIEHRLVKLEENAGLEGE